jgi:yeast amino acid transporter
MVRIPLHNFRKNALTSYAGMGPKIFAYVDKKGRPVTVVIVQLLFGCLAFINLAKNGGDIFNWLLSLSGLSILFIYGATAFAHIRFRAAW